MLAYMYTYIILIKRNSGKKKQKTVFGYRAEAGARSLCKSGEAGAGGGVIFFRSDETGWVNRTTGSWVPNIGLYGICTN
jgi:hypothetical protein